MTRIQDSAYAALGLKPGAPRSAVDEAYRRLIKLHHPDRSGGDGGRAAEINRAYTILRRDGLAIRPRPQRMPVPVKRPRQSTSRRWGMLWALVLIGAGIAAYMTIENPRALGKVANRMAIRLPAISETPPLVTPGAPLTSFDEPLNSPVIDSAIATAVGFHSSGDQAGAREYSRHCQMRLRQQANLAWFDACTAFDEATLTLQGEQISSVSGAFDESSVVAREVTAARALSGDVVGADFRLHRIRSQVEVKLLPLLDPAAGGDGQLAASAAPEEARPSGF